MKKLLLSLLAVLLVLPAFPASTIYGGGEKLLYRESHFEAARERIARYGWAADLYGKLEELADGRLSEVPDRYANLGNDSYRSVLAALCYRISGEEKYLPLIKKQLVKIYLLDTPSKKMFPENPDHNNTYYWQKMMEDWCRMLQAYDLVKNHPDFLPYKELMESRMDEIIEEGYIYESRVRRIGNTQIWGVTGLGVYGFMRENEKAIELSINGPKGFKAQLAKFRDEGSFWPEPKQYSYGYVDCCFLWLCELARNNGWKEDLYEYTDPVNGACMRKMIRSLLASTTPDGFSVTNGEGSECVIPYGGRYYYDKCGVFSQNIIRQNIKLPVYYHALKDPQVAWAMKKFPANDEFCILMFGYPALLYGGLPEGAEIEAPSASSVVWPEMGDALLRSDESSHYWDGEALTIHLRNGASIQYHSEHDHFGIVLNAFGKNLYHHWFHGWDYLCPRKGRPNQTPFSQRLLNSNSVTVDFREPDGRAYTVHKKQSDPEWYGVEFSDVCRSGNMKFLSVEGGIYNGVSQKRTIGLVGEYVIDVFTLSSKEKHNYDYTLHSWGKLNVDGTGKFTPYTHLNEEYGFGPIDIRYDRPGNIWMEDARMAKVKGTLLLDFVDTDGIAVASQVLPDGPTQVISTGTPFFYKHREWENPESRYIPLRKPMAIVRRQCSSTAFIVLHQPYRSGDAILDFSRKGDRLMVKGKGFTDTIDIRTLEYTRVEH